MEIQKKYIHGLQVTALVFLLPCLYGCQGGGGGGSSASLSSFAFGAGDNSGSLPLILDSSSNSGNSGSSTDTTTGTGTQLGTIHNPEPATMLLFGSGIVAMRLARNRKNSLKRDQKR